MIIQFTIIIQLTLSINFLNIGSIQILYKYKIGRYMIKFSAYYFLGNPKL